MGRGGGWRVSPWFEGRGRLGRLQNVIARRPTIAALQAHRILHRVCRRQGVGKTTHSDCRTTAGYTHINMGMQHAAMGELAGLLRLAEPTNGGTALNPSSASAPRVIPVGDARKVGRCDAGKLGHSDRLDG